MSKMIINRLPLAASRISKIVQARHVWSLLSARHPLLSARTPMTPRMTPVFATGGGDGGSGSGPKKFTGGSGGADDGNKGFAASLWEQYLALLDSAPILTRSITCAILNGLGDVFCQLFLEGASGLDLHRTFIFTMLGGLYVGPILFFWYSFLGRAITLPGMQGVLASLAADQLIFAPVFVGSFMAILSGIGGSSVAEIQGKLQRDLFDAVKVNWCLWVPAQFINFRFVPPNLRVLATNFTALIWNVYMSWQSHKA